MTEEREDMIILARRIKYSGRIIYGLSIIGVVTLLLTLLQCSNSISTLPSETITIIILPFIIIFIACCLLEVISEKRMKILSSIVKYEIASFEDAKTDSRLNCIIIPYNYGDEKILKEKVRKYFPVKDIFLGRIGRQMYMEVYLSINVHF